MWLMFFVAVTVGGQGELHAVNTLPSQQACMSAAREFNAQPNPEGIRWKNAGCLHIPVLDGK